MKKIQIKKWMERAKDPKTNKLVEVEANTIVMLNWLISKGVAEEKLQGFHNMRILNRLGKALDDARGKKILILEDSDYELIEKFLKKYSPAEWGTNSKMMEAAEAIMEPENLSAKNAEKELKKEGD